MEHTTIGQVVSWLDTTFRPELQEDYDNAGFLIGQRQTPCTGVLIALDLTPAVVDEAISLGLNLIVTHHPLIFNGLKRITSDNEAGRTVISLIQHGIAVYAAHTNLDNLPWGVNGILAEKLCLTDCHILRSTHSSVSRSSADSSPNLGEQRDSNSQQQKPSGSSPKLGEVDARSADGGVCNPDETGAGMVGKLPHPIPAEAFLLKLKETLGIPTLRTSPLERRRPAGIRTVALCGGSGAFLIPDAIAAHADIYITADLKYHDFQRPEGRIILVDAGHYETEQFAKEIFYRAISEKFSNFACRISTKQESLVQYI
ncbi:MAG: Nif3-like dinuclear metal center hexameric protein [Bacteroidales bacterium]|nr:Nif3-like dinuclear metal center hexameric protein [Bacteroidales bacterium]